MRDRRFLYVFTRRACQQQHRGCLVDLVNDGKILERGFAFAASTAVSNAHGTCYAPGIGQDFDFALVLVVGGFAFDVADFCKDIDCHREPLNNPLFDCLPDRP